MHGRLAEARVHPAFGSAAVIRGSRDGSARCGPQEEVGYTCVLREWAGPACAANSYPDVFRLRNGRLDPLLVTAVTWPRARASVRVPCACRRPSTRETNSAVITNFSAHDDGGMNRSATSVGTVGLREVRVAPSTAVCKATRWWTSAPPRGTGVRQRGSGLGGSAAWSGSRRPVR